MMKIVFTKRKCAIIHHTVLSFGLGPEREGGGVILQSSIRGCSAQFFRVLLYVTHIMNNSPEKEVLSPFSCSTLQMI